MRTRSQYRAFLVCCHQYHNNKRLFGDRVVVVSTCDAAYALDISVLMKLWQIVSDCGTGYLLFYLAVMQRLLSRSSSGSVDSS